ncbi:homoserine O-acetyltransferase [Janibacter sp. FSL W8-0316]|uniref:homoserine O-acetyltransferase MetX n=1 Tax=Janibacter sp. FSL W8-0316 TaxID=2975325 RepID=UPI0030F53D6D
MAFGTSSPFGDFEFVPPAARFVDLPSHLVLHRGGLLEQGRIAYETLGTPSPRRDNTVLVLTGLSAGAHIAAGDDDPLPGWWEGIVGPGRAIDTNRWHVVCINSLGSCFGSSGPASVNSRTGQPYRLAFPEISIEDIADSAAYVVTHLGIQQLAAVVGCSMGGMSALSLFARHPHIASAHISVCAAPQSTDFAIAVRSIQREVILQDPAWAGGAYIRERFPRQGLVTARKLGMLSYRGAREWEVRFGRTPASSVAAPFDPEFAVEGYLQHHANRFSERFDPNCYLYLSRASDRFTQPQTPAAAGALRYALVLGAETDLLSPPDQQESIIRRFRSMGVETTGATLESPHGHDSFLVDIVRFGDAIGTFLSSLPSPSLEKLP